MRRQRHVDLRGPHHALAAEADEAGETAARPALVDAVEVDEADGFAGAVRVSDTGAQPAGDERQVRVGVARLVGALLGIEVEALVQAVVLVAGAFREERAEGFDVRRDPIGAQAGGQAPIQKAGGRVERPIQAIRVGAQSLVLG
jgi:hypothetical protein